ncbi:OCT1 [[Candida] subhashii]|uniref:Mitochondrial intermediate peptidase n=1 Tax=[Candida] subhashii TaxID=561895 RepID=A0A8J5QI83_9ASCO|nr:OCT1 [[Candida] subhashii]KAG7662469.1 OCT1 [[Candida] subhashii]
MKPTKPISRYSRATIQGTNNLLFQTHKILLLRREFHHRQPIRKPVRTPSPINANLPPAYLHLRKVFDDQKYFNNFNKPSTTESIFDSSPRTGLFKNEYLSSPNGLVEFSKTSLVKAKALVQEMLREVRTNHGKLIYIKKMDQLSDIICRVIDVAEFIRVVHPSSKWVNAAQETHEIMYEFMNQLNINVDLYAYLRDILNDKYIRNELTEEEIKVGEYLKQDFERSGIHMDPETRNNFVAITQEISLLGSQFNNEISSLESYWCEITEDEFNQIEDPMLKQEIQRYQYRHMHRKPGVVVIPLAEHLPFSLLNSCSIESIRKKLWVALHSSPKDQILRLNRFVEYRALLSRMLGYKSFAHYQLEHKMAKNPENVVTFLSNLQKSLKSTGVLEELSQLYKYRDQSKDESSSISSPENIINEIKPWDRDYLLNKLQQKQHAEPPSENISEYFSVGTIIAGLSKLFESLYGVSLVPQATLSGETWDQQQVRKLQVIENSTNKTLGYLYLDFWSDKVLPSHFTICCSRKLNTDIETESIESMEKLVQLDEDYQLPIISLICNFSNRKNSIIGRFAGVDNCKPTLLSLDQVDTIFHEMGHAMHSMLGRTQLHNLSGTRCATDFVELPSVLMEYFSKDPRVICQIGRHYESNSLLPKELLSQSHKQRIMLNNCENFMQSKMAMLDQVLHNEDTVKNLPKGLDTFDSTKIYHELENKLEVFADEYSTWHGKFPHLFSYGAVYYSYLLDRAIAEKIWQGLFSEDPWSKEAGTKYRESILKWGGTRDPWECLADALGQEELKKGDAKAMEIIGQSAHL